MKTAFRSKFMGFYDRDSHQAFMCSILSYHPSATPGCDGKTLCSPKKHSGLGETRTLNQRLKRALLYH